MLKWLRWIPVHRLSVELGKTSRDLSYWWLEYWYRFTQKWIDPWYYPIKDYFFPHNVQKIRNCPRSWNDRSERILHCIFSMLCDFVEREKGGREKYAEEVAWHYQQWQESRIKSRKIPKSQRSWYESPRQMKDYYERDREILELYDWYMSVDWTNPAGIDWYNPPESIQCWEIEKSWRETEDQMMIRAIRSRGSWWT